MGLLISHKAQVIVAGGGPAGVMAAIAAARQGARTLLVEQNGFVGGMAVVGIGLLAFHNNRAEQIVAGIPWELVTRLKALDAAAEARNIDQAGPGAPGGTEFVARVVILHPEAFKYVALEMLREAGVELALHTYVSDVITAGGAVAGLVVDGKSGRSIALADCIVDCTGDADVAVRAGVRYEQGRPVDEVTQPMTLFFQLTEVDIAKAEECGAAVRKHREVLGSQFWRSRYRSYTVELGRWKEDLRRELPDFAEGLSGFSLTDLGDGVFHAGNMIHISRRDGTDSRQLTAAEVDARTLAWRLIQFARAHIPGFEGAHLVNTAPFIGVRETRRICGEYRLTYEDVIGARSFDDVVALGGYWVDIHDYNGSGFHVPAWGVTVRGQGHYGIPYRCLIPQGVDGLLVAGRCISASHEGQASLRVVGTCMATGHAAGAAAALSIQRGEAPRDLDVRLLQGILMQQGALLTVPEAEGPKTTDAAPHLPTGGE